MKDNGQVLLISRGDLESLLLTLIIERECEEKQNVQKRVRYVRLAGANAEQRLRCASLQAELLDTELELIEPGSLATTERMILFDGIESSAPGSRLAWPQRCGPNAAALASELAMAEHLLQANALNSGVEGVELFSPLIDLEPTQVLDLAFDLGAPFQASWPCDQGADEPCGTCPGCKLWAAAASKLGRPWPWSVPTPA